MMMDGWMDAEDHLLDRPPDSSLSDTPSDASALSSMLLFSASRSIGSKAAYPLRTASFIVLPSYVGCSDALLKYIAIAVMILIES